MDSPPKNRKLIRFSARDYAKQYKIAPRTARERLLDLCDRGLVRRVGNNHQTKYTLAPRRVKTVLPYIYELANLCARRATLFLYEGKISEKQQAPQYFGGKQTCEVSEMTIRGRDSRGIDVPEFAPSTRSDPNRALRGRLREAQIAKGRALFLCRRCARSLGLV